MFDASDIDELVLSYATTIHKSQGSEFPIVIVPITTSHFTMLQRNLIYTAITRAKKTVVIIGTKRAMHIAVSKRDSAKRNTTLKERIIGELQKKLEKNIPAAS